jgi:hypothetical protein
MNHFVTRANLNFESEEYRCQRFESRDLEFR